MKLERMKREEGYYYLSAEDSRLYDVVKDNTDKLSRELTRVLLDKAAQSRAAHCASTY